MQFQPQTDEQLEADAEERKRKAAPWKPGPYDFEVRGAEDTTSKAGNEMIVLNIACYNDQGDIKEVNDYLLASTAEKLKRAAYAVGLGKEYEEGNLTAYDFQGRTGTLELRIKRQVGYQDKNEVSGYIVSGKNGDALAASTRPRMADKDLDDEIPF